MTRRRAITILSLLLAILVIGAVLLAGSSDPAAEERARQAPDGEVPDPAPHPNELPGAAEVQAIAASYPGRVADARVRDGEWALLMDDTWYYWAEGRLLPDALRAETESYVSIRFYRYELGPLQEREITPELSRVLEDRTSRQSSGDTDTRERFNDFLDTLYEISSEADAERIVRRIEFLGSATRVHPLLVEPLERVERTLLARAPHDPELGAFLSGLASVHGYNWRNIAGTVRRSYHSYGVAVDLVPQSYRGQWPYWLWAAQGGVPAWWELPVEERWSVPQAVIDAFEDNGFIWGGKWLFFDNLHFEYRPESIYMARNPLELDRPE